MLPPPIQLQKNQCLALIALVPDDEAKQRYSKIIELLKSVEGKVFEYIAPSILVRITTEDPAGLSSKLLPLLGDQDLITLIAVENERLVTHLVFHRAQDDRELRETAEFWTPSWIK